MVKCDFCDTIVYGYHEERLPEGWGHVRLAVGRFEFCPKHLEEAKKKMDLVVNKQILKGENDE